MLLYLDPTKRLETDTALNQLTTTSSGPTPCPAPQDAQHPWAEHVQIRYPFNGGRDVDAAPPHAAASQSAAQRGVHRHGQGRGD